MAIKIAGTFLRFIDFHFYYRICSLLVRKANFEQIIYVNNYQIIVDRNDPYWMRLISRHFKYEPELENWLRNECTDDIFFVDCGANIGYWSLFVSKILGVESLVCVEPNPKVFKLLVRNLNLNNVSGLAIEGAVGIGDSNWSKTMLYFNSSPGMHVGASIHNDEKSELESIEVSLVNLSDLISPALIRQKDILLKLDVEGAEIMCIKQIPDQYRKSIRIIYEDHGSDRESLTTKWLLESGKYKISFLSPTRSLEINSIEILTKLKKSRTKGYNLVAIPI
jgi:FkbM family methyltransferase